MRGTCKSILIALRLPQALSSASAPALLKVSTPAHPALCSTIFVAQKLISFLKPVATAVCFFPN